MGEGGALPHAAPQADPHGYVEEEQHGRRNQEEDDERQLVHRVALWKGGSHKIDQILVGFGGGWTNLFFSLMTLIN